MLAFDAVTVMRIGKPSDDYSLPVKVLLTRQLSSLSALISSAVNTITEYYMEIQIGITPPSTHILDSRHNRFNHYMMFRAIKIGFAYTTIRNIALSSTSYLAYSYRMDVLTQY